MMQKEIAPAVSKDILVINGLFNKEFIVFIKEKGREDPMKKFLK